MFRARSRVRLSVHQRIATATPEDNAHSLNPVVYSSIVRADIDDLLDDPCAVHGLVQKLGAELNQHRATREAKEKGYQLSKSCQGKKIKKLKNEPKNKTLVSFLAGQLHRMVGPLIGKRASEVFGHAVDLPIEASDEQVLLTGKAQEAVIGIPVHDKTEYFLAQNIACSLRTEKR